MISKLKVGVESYTWSVVTPVQSISRQRNPGSECTAVVNHASLATLALFTATSHHRLQWSVKTMKTPDHIHRSGWSQVSYTFAEWVHDAWCFNSTFRPRHLLPLNLTWFCCGCLYVSDFRTVCVWKPTKGLVAGRGSVSSSASLTLALWHLLTWLTSHTHKQQKWIRKVVVLYLDINLSSIWGAMMGVWEEEKEKGSDNYILIKICIRISRERKNLTTLLKIRHFSLWRALWSINLSYTLPSPNFSCMQTWLSIHPCASFSHWWRRDTH